MKTIKLLVLIFLFFNFSAHAQKIFIVDTLNDDTDLKPGDGACLTALNECSLRAAIEEANATPNGTEPDSISFTSIPTVDEIALISVQSELPAITEAAIIDATTASGEVILDGSLVKGGDGFTLDSGSDGSKIRGFTIGNFESGTGIWIDSNDNKIEDNRIGVSNLGVAYANGTGLTISGNNNEIGGIDKGNVVGHSDGLGIYILSGDDNIISGNYIGTDQEGQNFGNYEGINVSGNDNKIGGQDAAQGNVIGWNTLYGIHLSWASGTIIRNNYIGTDTKSRDLGNDDAGIFISGGTTGVGDTKIGGKESWGNVIGFNQEGIRIDDSDNNRIRGNFIGINRYGARIGNAGAGIFITEDSDNNVVGYGINGTIDRDAPKGNTIAYNQSGIVVATLSASLPTQNTFRGNSLFENLQLGIDLEDDGGTPNDGSADADTGPNDLQNFPVITSVFYHESGGTALISIKYKVASVRAAARALTVDAYLYDGSGEGKTYIGSQFYDTSFVKTLDIDPTSFNWDSTDKIVLTATDAIGNTSEFSLASDEIGGPGYSKSLTIR